LSPFLAAVLTIANLNVVVLPARGAASKDAIVILQGGPGQAATPLESFYAGVFDAARESRDIVLIDQRGTGKSGPLNCDVLGPTLFPVDKVIACRDSLKVDLKKYTTAHAVEDLDRVRRSLGYDAWDLYGTSYGTRVAMEYARRFPKHTRSMVLKGVVAPTLRYTVDPAIDTEASLNRVIAEASPLFPNLRAELQALSTRVDVAFVIRNMLHSLPELRALPAFIHAGDAAAWESKAQSYYSALNRGVSTGMYLSVICSEDIWRVSDEEAKRLTAGTVTGDSWQRALSAACAVWPHASPQKEISKPLRSSVPTLLISGAYDPVTPPHQAEDAARLLKNSRHVIVKYGSHSFAAMSGCVDRMISEFVLHPEPALVDSRCAAAIPPVKYEH